MATPELLRDPTLPGLLRRVFRAAGAPDEGSGDRFVLRSGADPPDLLAKLLEEAFVDDGAEVVVWRSGDRPDYGAMKAGGLAARAGFGTPRPEGWDGRNVLEFAVERRDPAGRLRAVTWVGLPEEEPAPEADFQAAVVRADAPEAVPGHATRQPTDPQW